MSQQELDAVWDEHMLLVGNGWCDFVVEYPALRVDYAGTAEKSRFTADEWVIVAGSAEANLCPL